MVILAKLADYRRRLVDGSRDEIGIFSMSCVPVASIKNSDGLVVARGKTLEVPNEAMLVVDLEFPEVSLKTCRTLSKTRTFNSGLEDMVGGREEREKQWKKQLIHTHVNTTQSWYCLGSKAP